MIGVESPAGCEGGGAIASRWPTLFPADAGTPSIDRHSGQWRARNVAKQLGRGLQEEHDRGSAMADLPPDSGPGNRRPPLLDAAGQSVDVVGRWAYETAGSGWVSSAVAHV